MKVLVVDDDEALLAELSAFLELSGHEALRAASLAEARSRIARADAALVDLRLGPESGMALLEGGPRVPTIVVSGHGGVAEAVAAVRAGAYDFLEKPADPDRLLGLLRNIEAALASERRLDALRDEWLAEHAAFAPGSPFEAAAARVREAAASPLSLLLAGPSGSGKDILARYAHRCSSRASGPFVSVNCAAIQSELAESVLFGVRRGAFTGADADRPGWFQAADGGTLFLDEIGDLPLPVQAKLLRAAESGEVQRLGSAATERADVRLVSATAADLEAMVAAGRFRADLYYRVAGALVRVPPLSERPGDIGPIAARVLERLGGGAFPEAPRLAPDALAWLEARPWPGNARELRALVERAAWARRGGELRAADLDAVAAPEGQGASSTRAAPATVAPSILPETAERHTVSRIAPLREAKAAFERDYVERALETAGGSVAGAAALLGLLPNNLSRKLRELGLERDPEGRR